jgi:AcrR family transcriptional regulator
MAKLSKVDAAKAAGVSRQTLYTYIKDRRISVDADGLIDTAELLRAGFTLHEIGRQDLEPVGHNLTSKVDTLDVYLDMITLLKQQLSDAQAREQAARQREQSASEREALLWQMSQAERTRYDRLLEAPRALPTTPVTVRPRSSAQAPVADRGDIRRRILALGREHPEGLSPAHTRQLLDIEKDLGATMKAMLREGLLKRVTHGQYAAID